MFERRTIMLALATSGFSVVSGINLAKIMLISFRTRAREIGLRDASEPTGTVFSTNSWLER
jgi:ABC-type antimicrobial peptide transport system permease subunit